MKFYDEEGECIVSGFIGVDLHHVKSRGSRGSNEPFNLMPLAHKFHVMLEQIGIEKFIGLTKEKNGINGATVKEWLLLNEWECCEISKKWFHWRHCEND